mgnify:CR=1 FL=1
MVHGYMNNAGYEDVREAVAASLNQRFGTAFHKENILMTVGAAGGMNVLMKTLLNPGDEVLTFAPYFGEYRAYVTNYDGILKEVEPDTETFQPKPEKKIWADAQRKRQKQSSSIHRTIRPELSILKQPFRKWQRFWRQNRKNSVQASI